MRALPACRTLAVVALLGPGVPALAAGTGIVYVDSSSGVQTTDAAGRATFSPSNPVAAGGVGNHLVVSLGALGSGATIASVTYDQMAMTRLASRVTTGDACRVELWELPLAAPDGLSHDVVVRASASGVVLAATAAQFRGVRARVAPALIGAATGTADPATVTAATGPGQFSVAAACNRGTAGSRVALPVSPSDGFITNVSFDPLSLGALRADSGVMASQTVSWTVTGTSQGWAAVIATLPGDPPVPADAGVDGSALVDSRPDGGFDAAAERVAAADGAGDDGAGDDGPRSQGDDGPRSQGDDGPRSQGDDARLPGDVAPPGGGAAPADDAGRGRRALDLHVGCACRTARAAPGGGALFPAAAALALLRRHLRRRQAAGRAKVGPRGGGWLDMKIGIIGSGNIGGALGPLWAKAGHQVFYSSRNPDRLAPLVARTGAGAQAGTIEAAARFGEIVLLAVPYGALPELGPKLAPLLQGKPVLDAGNPYPERDGQLARDVLASGQGSGVGTARYLPGARLVRAFNTVWSRTLDSVAHRAGDRVGIPLASDDRGALDQAATLARDAGFDPVVVGPLASAARFDVGTEVYNTGMSGPDVRRRLGLG